MIDNVKDSPRPKQLAKYKNGVEYLIENGITFPSKMKPVLFKLLGIGEN